MAATLALSGGGQEDPLYPLQRAGVPAGFPLEESLFGSDKAGASDYTQVTTPAPRGGWAWPTARPV